MLVIKFNSPAVILAIWLCLRKIILHFSLIFLFFFPLRFLCHSGYLRHCQWSQKNLIYASDSEVKVSDRQFCFVFLSEEESLVSSFH